MTFSRKNMEQWAERYLDKKLSEDELTILKVALDKDYELKADWESTLTIIKLLKRQGENNVFRQKIITAQTTPKANRKNKVIPFYRKTGFAKIAAVAATLVILTTLAVNWLMSPKKPQMTSQYQLLRREIENIKNSQSKVLDSLGKLNPQEPFYGGSGFALSNNGFIATNYHVVKDAHSIYVQTSHQGVFKARLIGFEAESDVAILKIDAKNFRFSHLPIPYNLNPKTVDLGQQVFTVGYPQNNLVYNEGYISCEKGFDNDSTSYQLEMVANPGQSGAPVLDKSGRIIALVTGKQSNTNGTTFAVHTDALLNLIDSLPDSTRRKIRLPKINRLKRLNRTTQVNRIKPYICAIRVN